MGLAVAARVAAVVMAAVVGEGREQPGAVQVAALLDSTVRDVAETYRQGSRVEALGPDRQRVRGGFGNRGDAVPLVTGHATRTSPHARGEHGLARGARELRHTS